MQIFYIKLRMFLVLLLNSNGPGLFGVQSKQQQQQQNPQMYLPVSSPQCQYSVQKRCALMYCPDLCA